VALWWILLGFLIGLLVGLPWKHKHRPEKLVLVLPILTSKGEKPVPNYELANDAVAYVPIQTLDAEGNPVAPPSGDTFTVASSDTTSLGVAVGTMPSGPLQGQPAAVLTPLVPTASGITVTLTDADNLTAGTQVVDIVQGVATTDFLDVSAAVTVPQAPPA
jgi:hypothetical protein